VISSTIIFLCSQARPPEGHRELNESRETF
jgi:hypothetical protein